MPEANEVLDDGDGQVLRLPADLQRLNEARRFVTQAVVQWGADPPDDAALLTSEVVANAMIHAGGPIVVRVKRAGARARVEVSDQSVQLPEVQPPFHDRPGGNGLNIVKALASSWGVIPIRDEGKIVWFEVPLLG